MKYSRPQINKVQVPLPAWCVCVCSFSEPHPPKKNKYKKKIMKALDFTYSKSRGADEGNLNFLWGKHSQYLSRHNGAFL